MPASDFNYDAVNKTCVCPGGVLMLLRRQGLDNRGVERINFSGRPSKCRECKLLNMCMSNPKTLDKPRCNGRQVSFIVYKEGEYASHTDWMKERVDSEKGKGIYGHRMSVVEPVFANICSNKKLNRFSLRGKTKVQGQWQLFCMIQNIEKIVNYGNLVA